MREKYRELTAYLQKAVQIPSVNPPGKEEQMCEYVEDYLQNIPCEKKVVEVSAGRKVIMAKLASGSAEPGILFTGHMDVVPVSENERVMWEHNPFGGEIEGGRLCGRGATDMKSGLIAAMVAFGDMAKQVEKGETKLCRDVFFVATIDEEDGMAGSKSVAADSFLVNGKDVVVCEPTSLKIATASKGRTYGELIIGGHTAHGSEFHPSSNAILLANEIINEMNQAEFMKETNRYGSSFWQVLAIHAGVEPCVVPDCCRMKFDARLVPGDETEHIWQEMETVIDKVRRRMGDFSVEKKVIDRREPWVTEEETDFFQRVKAVYKELREQVETTTFPGTTDGTIFRRENRNVLIFGPGNLQLAHRQNEYVQLSEYFRAYEIYMALMRR